MKPNLFTALLLIIVLFFQVDGFAQIQRQSVPFTSVKITDKFWGDRLKTHSKATLSTCVAQMQDSTKRIANFRRAAGLEKGKHEGIYFDDSDVYKAMEGMAYSLINNPNPELEALLETWIGLIAKSQQPDGYLNTYYTLNFPEKRLTDMEKHELYCGGHMIEAAVAHHRATGKDTFLNVAIGFADFLDRTFGPGKRHWVTGHEEVELALVKLYHETNEVKYLNLAHWFLEERGHGYGVGAIWSNKKMGPKYCQDDIPVSEISEITGHAVRAMYLFTGMADVAKETKNKGYIDAMKRVWEDVVFRNMYLTGGIGSSGSNEGFTVDYDLPNKEAYAETCASIGMVYWNNRMNLLTGESSYADIMERAMYNGVLSGVSLSGDLFFYENPLESDGDHHRQRWFGCACCPSNISRFLPSVGNYVYTTSDDQIYANLYIQSKSEIEFEGKKVTLEQTTNYPWEGNVEFKVSPSVASEFELNLRIPGWCTSYQVLVNGKLVDQPNVLRGYLSLKQVWKKGDQVSLRMDMPVEIVAADPRVKADIGARAIQRGPLVYCIEETDNTKLNWADIKLNASNKFEVKNAVGVLEGMKEIKTNIGQGVLTFVPYNSWDNRAEGKMKVWIPYNEM